MEVRSEYGSGKFLFEWDPVEDTIDIVQKGMYYRIQLLRKETGGTYRIVDNRNRPPHNLKLQKNNHRNPQSC
jgi:hypothetical protein